MQNHCWSWYGGHREVLFKMQYKMHRLLKPSLWYGARIVYTTALTEKAVMLTVILDLGYTNLMISVQEEKEKMPTKGEQQGYTYMALINGEWKEVTIQESPLELVERFEQDEEWTRVRHGHWILSDDRYWKTCSECGTEVDVSMRLGIFVDDIEVDEMNYCPNCGAKMDEIERNNTIDELSV